MKARNLKPGMRLEFFWGAGLPLDHGTVRGVESDRGLFYVRVDLDYGGTHRLMLSDRSTDDEENASGSPIGWTVYSREEA